MITEHDITFQKISAISFVIALPEKKTTKLQLKLWDLHIYK